MSTEWNNDRERPCVEQRNAQIVGEGRGADEPTASTGPAKG